MMSSSADEDSFLFLLGGLGREEEEGLVLLCSFSESEEKRSTEPRTWLFLIPLDMRSRLRTERDLRFFRIPLHRGPSISPDDTLNRTLPKGRLSEVNTELDSQQTPAMESSTTVLLQEMCNYPNSQIGRCYVTLLEVRYPHEIPEGYIHKQRNPKLNSVKGCQIGKYPNFQIQLTF